MRELHIFAKSRSRKLKAFEREAAFATRKPDCLPDGGGGICFNVEGARMSEAGRIAERLGLKWMPGGAPASVFVACRAIGAYLYAVDAGANTFRIWDISDPAAPITAGTLALDSQPADLDIYASIAYVICADGKLHVINIDDPAAPAIIPNGTVNTGDTYAHVKVAGGVAFLSGPAAAAVTMWDINQAPPKQFDTQSEVAGSSVAVQGRRLFFGESAGTPKAQLRNYQIGGYSCAFIKTYELEVVSRAVAEILEARHLYVKGEGVFTQVTIVGSDADEAGVLCVANYIKLGSVFIMYGTGNPDTTVAAPIGSSFHSDDGNIYRNTDGATAWTAM